MTNAQIPTFTEVAKWLYSIIPSLFREISFLYYLVLLPTSIAHINNGWERPWFYLFSKLLGPPASSNDKFFFINVFQLTVIILNNTKLSHLWPVEDSSGWTPSDTVLIVFNSFFSIQYVKMFQALPVLFLALDLESTISPGSQSLFTIY